MSAKKSIGRLRITWTRSAIGRISNQGRVIAALGLHRLNHSVVHDDSPIIRGMINKVTHLVKVESIEA